MEYESKQTRREFSQNVGLGMLGLALGCGTAAGPQSNRAGATLKPGKGQRPNILFIIADNLGRESVGLYGGTLFKTPRTDSIGRDGIVFDHCYIGSPLCSPARAGFMTGRSAWTVGINTQASPGNPDSGLRLEEITIAETLKAAGYSTAIFGKWNLGYDEKYLPAHQGFDVYYGINAGHADYYTHEYDKKGKFFYNNTTKIDPEGFVDNLCTDEALQYLDSRKNASDPFFMVMAFFTPHGPYQNPPGYPATDNKLQIYGNMIDNMDKNIGRLLDKLDAIGAADNTLVIFISDQGSSEMNEYKRDLTEGSLLVACYAKWPEHIKPGVRVNTPFISYDFFPTFNELGGGVNPADRAIHGKSLTPLFEGGGPCQHEAFYWVYGSEDAIREGDWKLNMNGGKVTGLYNLKDDPEAKMDLSKTKPDLVERLVKKLQEWKTANAPKKG